MQPAAALHSCAKAASLCSPLAPPLELPALPLELPALLPGAVGAGWARCQQACDTTRSDAAEQLRTSSRYAPSCRCSGSAEGRDPLEQ